MKNKPTRHKETNTFQFKPFSERITEIDVDIFHHVRHRNEDISEEIQTYFHETLQKWNVLNLTEDYTTFKKQVRNIVTLPELLHRKRYVIDMLMEYLKKRDSLFLQPILELIVAVARDLQKDFYEYFPEFLSEIVCLLQTKDAEQIEYTFTTLAYLFKYLWRYLIRNVRTVLALLLPLLADTQPVYINRFAAESFAFVVRKIKDKDSFLKLVLQILRDNVSGVLGYGKLLFEVVSGTPGQFHSCAEQMLSVYFNALQDQSVDQNLTYQVLEEIVTCILQSIHPQKCDVMWNIILKMLDTFIEKLNQSTLESDRQHALVLSLRLIHIIINYKNGKFLINPVSLTTRFAVLIDKNEDNNVLQEVINASVAILLASNIKLMQEDSTQLLLKIMTVNDRDMLYSSVESLIHYSSFETLVLPNILRRSISIGFDSETLLLFAKIIVAKSPPCLNGITLDKWKKYVFDIRNIGTENLNYFLLELKTLSTDSVSLNAIRILITLPHLKPMHEEFKDALKAGLLFSYETILKHENAEDAASINKIAFVFLLTLESLIHVSEPRELHEFLENSKIAIINLVEKYYDNTYILNAIDLCLTYFAKSQHHVDYINSTSFNILHNNVTKKMNSPYQKIRLTVTHLYSLFSDIDDLKNSSMPNSGKSAFELVHLVECESTTVQNYRAKLLRLQALEFQSPAISNLDPKYHEFPLRYLIGNLYINFSLLWEPVSAVIASYGNKECSQFWPTFLNELTSNVSEIEWKPSFECQVVSSLEMLLEKHEDKPDLENHKILLWRCMTHFSHYAEMKNRDLTGLFIDFVNTNFFKSNSEDGKYCNVKKHKEKSPGVDNDTDENEDDEERDETAKAALADSKIRNYKVKLLIAQLQIFHKVLNPKMLYREAEMHQIYLDLLFSKNVDVQKAALNCLFAYKHKYLLPYKESLFGLISEKNLKNELTRFKLDRESNVISEEHRENLIPIVMRITYAKMVTKTSMRTGGKAGGFARRKMILRFLGGTQEDEMITFIKMAFKPFKSHVSLETNDEAFNLRRCTENIVNTIDLHNVMPPKRMQSAVNLLAIIIEQFGGKMSTKLLPRLLRILICILAEVTGILRRSEEVYLGYLPAIKIVRTNSIGILARFFTHFENYDWQQHEIDALYSVAIFPWLQKLPIEGIHSPTALLKLFMAWGQNSRYYPLFVKHQEGNESISPLPYVIQLLLNPQTHQSVVNAILEIIEKMLTLYDYGKCNENAMEVDEPFLPLTPTLTNLLEVDKKTLSSGVNYGSAVLLPHIPHILEFIKNKLKRSSKGINKTELLILSRISEFVSDAETCDTVLKLILPILIKKAAVNNEEAVMELLTTVINLVKIVDKPEIHIRTIAPLIGLVSDMPARKFLLRLYNTIAERSSEQHRETMTRDCGILTALNAWDHKWVDQPDFQKRLDAFGEISRMVEKNAITLEFGVTVMHNCFYFLKTESDLAMKDYSGQCLKLIGSRLAKEHQSNTVNRRYLMDDTILTLTRKGIISRSETVRLQSLAFLGHMALECADVHPILRDLSLLTNRADPEVDFFENMQHLQLHRRARALLKFCTLAKTLQKPMNPKTLTQFILPLSSSYLCNEAFVHKNSLLDAAIETVGMVCRHLPWHHYEIILKHYLNKLRSSTEYQKQLVRIVIGILDSFHYDLSKYKTAEEIPQIEAVSAQTGDDVAAVDEKEPDATVGDENLEETEQEAEEKLEKALDDDNVENIEEIEKDNKANKGSVPIIEKQTLLSQYGAKRVVSSISNGLLPQLHRSIVSKTRQDSKHKINRKKITSEIEEDDLLRVPIALALVKLLQKLPESLLNANLPGIFIKLCTFLKSRMESVRRVTREILQKIMITLGPKYLHHLLNEMNALLTKGYQVHVLVYTIQSVLLALKPYFQKFDINNNLQSILSVCKIDLFGLTAEEKEVAGIVRNVSEAKSVKSYDIFHILAEFITESCLLDLILPLKEVLMKTHSHKTVHKVVECLRNVSLGLADNTYIRLEQMLVFLYGVVSESIPSLLPEKESGQSAEEEAKTLVRRQSDCYIIPAEPKSRMGMKTAAKTTRHANVHVMIEFGLKLFHILLKRDKISSVEYKCYLEPFVTILGDCLSSQHVKLSTVALQCLNWMLKMDLASMQTSISSICTAMFSILYKYTTVGLSRGDNFDLVMATFKCMAVIVRDVKHFNIDADQLKILILYAEQNLYDSDKQATAFTLLKAIIHRKMTVPEMYTVMEKVAMLSITSELEHVKLQSRSVFYSYLMEYPLGKHLDKHISFYLTQLSYETQPGRMSALEMIHTIVTGFPLKALIIRSGLIFLMTGTRLINDDNPNCLKLCAKCIREMLARLPSNKRNVLFDTVLTWLSDSKIRHRTLAAQLCGIFVTVEKNEFALRLPEVLPLLLKQFHASFAVSSNVEIGKCVKLKNLNHPEEDNKSKDPETLKDHHLFQVFQLLLKISAHCPAFLTNEKYRDFMHSFAQYSQTLLAYPHIWVRLAATQLIGFILTSLDVDKVAEFLNNPTDNETQETHVYSRSTDTLRSLILDLVAQLHPDMTFEELADQVVKNLIFIAKILKSIKGSAAKNNEEDNEKNKEENNANLSLLPWLVRKLRKAVNVEITQAPKSTSVRTAVFKFIAGVVATIPTEHLNAILFSITSPLVREIATTEEANAELRRLAKEVATMIKKAIGNEEYAKLVNRVQQKLNIKRAERKKARAQQFVVDPELAAKHKLTRQQKKKEAKKRKLNSMKGKKVIKKRKKPVDLEI
ncbi:small subunit processome component 20 homolog [Ooceraea biroi]|uniref:small subunit processome component 20 homolog n=1 Tax=Ooceraea biroi TaxID=2015173 RepID=UPI000F089546|nr:small subunit processome component 20 homolog [Ooceraea biroi]